MRITHRLLVLFIVIAFAFGAFFYLFYSIKQEEMRVYRESDVSQRRNTIDALFQFKANNLMLVIDDYALSDDMVRYVVSPNPAWSERVLSNLIYSFGYSLVQVYDASANLIYSKSDDTITNIDYFRIQASLLDSLAMGQKHYYLSRHFNTIMANAVSSIHYTDDVNRERPARGYLLVSQAWDYRFLSEIAKALSYDIRVSLMEPTTEDNIEQYNTKIIRPIVDWNKDTVAWLVFYSSNPYLNRLGALGNLILFGTMGFILVFLLMQFMLIQQWITAPLNLISLSLKENDPEVIKPITTKKNEFADVALLIERFFAQKQELLQEIDERTRTELKLREIEEQTRKILITSPESIIVTDLEGRILSVNEETLRLLEIDNEDDLITAGVNIAKFIIKHDRNLFARMLQELFAGTYVKNQELTIDNGKDLRFPALLSASVIMDDADKPSKYIFITRDLTDLKNLELQLRQSQKLESIGTLAGGIAHDFNNIITIIAGYIALASGKVESDPEVIEDMDEALKACLRAKSLIGKILTFSRQSDQAVEEIILADIIVESLPMIRASIPTKVSIETDIQSYRFTMADATEMQQVLINLATNAYHAMRPDGGVLGISLKEVEGAELLNLDPKISLEHTYLHLAVSDTGCGMSREMITRIFDPYFSTKDVGEGSGLGLSIVHGIVNGYKGFISVDSVLGEGSTFNIYLPIAEVQNIKSQAPRLTEYPLIPAKILMVDDEPALAEIFCQSLTKSGYQVTAFHDSNLALQAFSEHPDDFELIIADITMPGLDGIELATKIKAIRTVPIILYTGFLDHSIQARTEQAGIKHVLNKPILPAELLNHVKEVLFLHRQANP